MAPAARSRLAHARIIKHQRAHARKHTHTRTRTHVHTCMHLCGRGGCSSQGGSAADNCPSPPCACTLALGLLLSTGPSSVASSWSADWAAESMHDMSTDLRRGLRRTHGKQRAYAPVDRALQHEWCAAVSVHIRGVAGAAACKPVAPYRYHGRAHWLFRDQQEVYAVVKEYDSYNPE